MNKSIEEISADVLRGIIERGKATEYLTRTGQLVESAGLLPQIARRLLEARARTNAVDFERALAEMAAAIRTMDAKGV